MTAGKGAYGGRKVREGTVVSDKMQKTVVVAVQSNVQHRLYRKTVRRTHKFMAHDGREQAHLGDLVRIVESAPVSRHKRWRVVEVLTRAELPELAPEAIDLDIIGEVKVEEAQEAPAIAPSTETVAIDDIPSPEPEAAEPIEEEVAEAEVEETVEDTVLVGAGVVEPAEQPTEEESAEIVEPEAQHLEEDSPAEAPAEPATAEDEEPESGESPASEDAGK